MNRNLTLDTFCEFTWMWNDQFHLQTEDGDCFIWSDPEYGGDNTIKKFDKTQEQLGEESRNESVPWGRDKGWHKIHDYCGVDVKLP